MSNNAMPLSSTSALARAWGVTTKDKSVLKFLESRQLSPFHTQNHGKGVMRFYETEKVIGLLPEFLKWQQRQDAERAANAERSPRGSFTQRRSALGEVTILAQAVGRIERKLDAIMDALDIRSQS